MFLVPTHPEPYAIDASTSRQAHEQALNSHTEIHGGGHRAICSKLNTKPTARRPSAFWAWFVAGQSDVQGPLKASEWESSLAGPCFIVACSTVCIPDILCHLLHSACKVISRSRTPAHRSGSAPTPARS